MRSTHISTPDSRSSWWNRTRRGALVTSALAVSIAGCAVDAASPEPTADEGVTAGKSEESLLWGGLLFPLIDWADYDTRNPCARVNYWPPGEKFTRSYETPGYYGQFEEKLGQLGCSAGGGTSFVSTDNPRGRSILWCDGCGPYDYVKPTGPGHYWFFAKCSPTSLLQTTVDQYARREYAPVWSSVSGFCYGTRFAPAMYSMSPSYWEWKAKYTSMYRDADAVVVSYDPDCSTCTTWTRSYSSISMTLMR
jgi:hypothetical protein